MTSSVDIFSRYKNECKILIETGCWMGDGVDRAFQSGFEKVYTCDINPELIFNVKEKFSDKNLIAEVEESQNFIEKSLSEINEKVVIFLDAHFMPIQENRPDLGFGEITVKDGVDPCPLMKELEIIKNHHIKDHVILIDDFQCFDTWMFDYLQFDDILDYIKTINPQYKYQLIENVLCFSVK